MNKIDLVKFVANKANMTNAQAADALEAVLEGIRVSVVENRDNVQLKGFGTFFVKERAERKGINPATKEIITYPAKLSAGFKPSKMGWF